MLGNFDAGAIYVKAVACIYCMHILHAYIACIYCIHILHEYLRSGGRNLVTMARFEVQKDPQITQGSENEYQFNE